MRFLNFSFAFAYGFATMVVIALTQVDLESVIPGFKAWITSRSLVGKEFIPAYMLAGTLLLLIFFGLRGTMLGRPRFAFMVGMSSFVFVGAILVLLDGTMPSIVSPLSVSVPFHNGGKFGDWVALQWRTYVPALIHIVLVITITWIIGNWMTMPPQVVVVEEGELDE